MEIFADINMVRWLLSVLVLALLLGGFAVMAPHIAKYRNTKSRKGKKKKLKLIETLHIDAKRKVVLIQTGDVEHVVLTGPNEDIHLYVEPMDELEEEDEEPEAPIGFLKEIPSQCDVQSKKTSKKKGKKSE
jgi:flagellar biogenesis protein FliO